MGIFDSPTYRHSQIPPSHSNRLRCSMSSRVSSAVSSVNSELSGRIYVAAKLARHTPFLLPAGSLDTPHAFKNSHRSCAAASERIPGQRTSSHSVAPSCSTHASLASSTGLNGSSWSIPTIKSDSSLCDVPIDELPEIPDSPQAPSTSPRCSTVVSLGSQGDLWRDAAYYLDIGETFAASAADLVNTYPRAETGEPEGRRPSVATTDSDDTLCEPDNFVLTKCYDGPDDPKFSGVHTFHCSLGSVGQVWTQADIQLVSGCETDPSDGRATSRGIANEVVDIEAYETELVKGSPMVSKPSEVRLRSRVAGIKRNEEYKRYAAYDKIKFPRKAKRQGAVWEDFILPGWEFSYGSPFRF